MIVTARAANHLHALEPATVAAILDALRDHPCPVGATIIDIPTTAGTYQAFVARHKDGSPVLLAVTERTRHADRD